MKAVKVLWSIAFAFAIVLLYATLTSLFVVPDSQWYVGLIKTPATPSGTVITIGWAVNYVLSIILLTRLIYRNDNYKPILLLIGVGVIEIVWSFVFFTCHSLLGGVICEIILLLTALLALSYTKRDDHVDTLLYVPIIAWYAYVLIVGFNLMLANL